MINEAKTINVAKFWHYVIMHADDNEMISLADISEAIKRCELKEGDKDD